MKNDFATILQTHAERYPMMQPQDFGKLIYQSEFGPRHMVDCPAQALARLQQEWQSLTEPAAKPQNPEEVGGGLSRFHLSPEPQAAQAAPLLNRLFLLTAQKHRGSPQGLQQRLRQLLALPQAARLPGLQQWLAGWRQASYQPVHHSSRFRRAYQPHYRLLRTEYALFFPVLLAAEQLLAQQERGLLAIDGRCGSGKTHLARLLAELFPARIVPMDDFYLPPAKRPADWRQRPAGHMDLARLQAEVLPAALSGQAIAYRPYSCGQDCLLPLRRLPPARLTIIEGSYCHHPELAGGYDLKIFLDVQPQEQKARLQAREGAYYPAFEENWLSQEENYLQRCAVEQTAQLHLDATCL